ncbi:MAG: DUF262 domain-containing protein [Gammaproteobacteria bacterium]|nr:DUF262 domain-containing protein [Gammaproteobacteria bacterium]
MPNVDIGQRSVAEWLTEIHSGSLRLPEFQRDVVWNQNQVCDLLEAILASRPVGCLLLLPKNEEPEEQFRVRAFDGIDLSGDKYSSLVLDGQQRLSALCRALAGTDKDFRYFITTADDEDVSRVDVSVRAFRKTLQWVNDPLSIYERELIPADILWVDSPGDSEKVHTFITNWFDDIDQLAENSTDVDTTTTSRKRQNRTTALSDRVRNFQLPFIQLRDGTRKLEAIDTFIKTNTSSQRLRTFDIVVGELLAAHESQLRDHRDHLFAQIPEIENYLDETEVGDLILKIACLTQNLTPTERQYSKKEVLSFVAHDLDKIVEGISWTIERLRADRIYDKQRLPSVIPLRVLPALHQSIPNEIRSGSMGNVVKTARAYMWRAFATERYSRSAATLLKEDYESLRRLIVNKQVENESPYWDSVNFPLPNVEKLLSADWPKRASRLPRTILAVANRSGARDISSDSEINQDNVRFREYHHLYPKGFLHVNAPRVNPNRAVNCVLIEARSNRSAAAKEPITYFNELCKKSSGGSKISERDIAERLRTHAVHSNDLFLRDSLSVRRSYEAFCKGRAKLIEKHLQKLVLGSTPSVHHTMKVG